MPLHKAKERPHLASCHDIYPSVKGRKLESNAERKSGNARSKVHHKQSSYGLRAYFSCLGSNSWRERPDSGGMLNPAMDPPGEPFSYFWHPTDVLGTLFAPVASEVTPEGYVYTGFGELMFFAGNPPQPVNQRIKTLELGYLPMVQYQVKSDNLTYNFTMFASDLGSTLEGVPVNFIRVEVKNETGAHTGFLASAFRVQPPQTRLERPYDFRFGQRFQLIPNRLTAGQMKFNPDWKYSFTDTSLVRDGSILYSFPQDPLQTSTAERDSGIRVHRFLSGEIEQQTFSECRTDARHAYGTRAISLYTSAGGSEGTGLQTSACAVA